MQNVIIKSSLRAHKKERYMRVDMLNSDTPAQKISGAEKTKGISTP